MDYLVLITFGDQLLGCFEDVLIYAKGLDFEEKPNYEYVRQVFRDSYNRQGFSKQVEYDWLRVRRKKREEKKNASRSLLPGTNKEESGMGHIDQSEFPEESRKAVQTVKHNIDSKHEELKEPNLFIKMNSVKSV